VRWARPISAVLIGVAAATAGYNTIKHLQTRTRPLGALTPIGEITSVQGQVEARLPKTVQAEPAEPRAILYSQEVLTTRAQGSAVVGLSSGAAVRIEQETRVILEIDANKPDVVILTLLAGHVEVMSPGPEGTLRLFRDGVELPLNARALNPAPAPLVPAGESSRQQATTTSTQAAAAMPALVATVPDESPTPRPTPPKVLPPYQRGQAPSPVPDAGQTLTDPEISKQIRTQTSFFQRCYLTFISRVQNQPNAPEGSSGPKGSVTVGFKIQNTGKVTDVRVVRSDFSDDTLHKCLTEVLGRTPFHAYTGELITVEAFPISLQ
jgi:hypothetical protein